MLLAIIMAIIGGISAFKKTAGNDKIGRFLVTVIGTIAGLIIGGVISGIICLMLYRGYSHQQIEYEKVELVAVNGASNVEGVFFLASGNINSKDYYVYYYKLPDGGKQYGKLPKENAVVYEEDRKDAYMAKKGDEATATEKVLKWVKILMLPLAPTMKSFDKYTIHVPKGTIKPGIDLGLK